VEPGWTDAPPPIELVGHIDVPMLFVHGEADPFVAPHQPRLLNAATGGRGRVRLVTAYGHAETGFDDRVVEVIAREIAALIPAVPATERPATRARCRYRAPVSGTPDPREVARRRDLLECAIASAPPYPARFDGRGIVVCAGGARMLTCAWVAIGVLRRVVGCDLPIELWHIGPDEIGTDIGALLAKAGVELVDALDVAPPPRTLGGWELKPYAVAHSRFREVLLLDADNVAIADPTFLFDAASYRDAGALFWPDIVRLGRGNPLWEVCGVPFADEWSLESGQAVIDKERSWDALQLCVHMNEHSDFYYRYSYGDKDTFYLAWRRAASALSVVPYAAKRAPYGLLQHDPQGRPLFQHRAGAKWLLRGDNPAFEGFVHQHECLELLDELRAKWDGRIFRPPAQAPADTALEAELVGSYVYRRVSSDEREIELAPANRVGAGRAAYEQRWYVADGVLVIEGEGRVTCRLRADADGVWRGRWERGDRAEVELAPLGHGAPRTALTGSRDIAHAGGEWVSNYRVAP
jgi:hypothetical protein